MCYSLTPRAACERMDGAIRQYRRQHMSPARLEKRFLKWYDAHLDAIFRHIRFRVFDDARAEELTQEVFLKAWDYLRRGNTIREPKAFFYRTANNLIIDHVRKKRAVQVSDREVQETIAGDTAHTLMDHTDARLALRALAQLSEEDRHILLLRYADGFSPKDIAALLNETPNVISIRITRAKKKLRALLSSKSI